MLLAPARPILTNASAISSQHFLKKTVWRFESADKCGSSMTSRLFTKMQLNTLTIEFP